jgi:hypothetical protein
MTARTAVAAESESDLRWRAWEARGVENDRRTAGRMRVLLLFVGAAVAIWTIVLVA